MDLFQDKWIHQIQMNPKLDIDVINVPKVRQWFHLIEHNDPKKSTFRCRLCSKYSEEFKVRKILRTDLANPNGLELKGKSPAYISNMINEHNEMSAHQVIVQDLKKKKKISIEKELNTGITVIDHPYTVTAHHMRLGMFLT